MHWQMGGGCYVLPPLAAAHLSMRLVPSPNTVPAIFPLHQLVSLPPLAQGLHAAAHLYMRLTPFHATVTYLPLLSLDAAVAFS